MANKYNLITELYNGTVKEVTGSHENWTAFLTSACKNYKCSFDEQLLIHAQRPDATAVLPIETWNKRFGRWVNKGAKGIAVFDRENARLKHYFDISDTHESQYSREVPLWQMNESYESEVAEALENAFGELDDNTSLAQSLISAADNLVTDNMADYLYELNNCREGSFLEELDELNVEVFYRETLKSSVAYMFLSRLGLDVDSYFDREDFQHIYDFNTPNTINALGTATSDIAELGLLEIASTILNMQRENAESNRVQRHSGTFAKRENTLYDENRNNERTGEQNEHNLFNAGRLSSARPNDTATGERSDVGQIRTDEEEILAEQPQNNVYESADDRQTQRSPFGNRADSTDENRNAYIANGENTGNHRAVESDRPNEMGGLDEQHSPFGGGDNTARLDLQLNTQTQTAEEHKPSAFFMPTSQQQTSLFAGQQFSISQQIIDEVLTSGGNEENSTLRIVSYFKKDHSNAENANFLKREYGDSGKGFIFGGNHVSVWFNENGLYIAVGDTALNTPNTTPVSWEQAAKRIRELLDLGRYMPQSELDKASGVEIKALSENLWFLWRDIEKGVDFFKDSDLFDGSFPDSTMRIAEFVAQPQGQQMLLNELAKLNAAYEENKDVLRFPYAARHLHDSLSTLSDLQREPLTFTADESVTTARPAFITQDELDRLLVGGSNIQHSKFRIYSYFLQAHTAKEKADFLKHDYGTGGFGRLGFNEWHNGKGITYSRENNRMPYDKVFLPWNKVAKRIDELIATGRY